MGDGRVNKAITYTGPPLHLNQIVYLRLFNIFEKIVVTKQVKDELLKFGAWPLFTKEMARHLQDLSLLSFNSLSFKKFQTILFEKGTFWRLISYNKQLLIT